MVDGCRRRHSVHHRCYRAWLRRSAGQEEFYFLPIKRVLPFTKRSLAILHADPKNHFLCCVCTRKQSWPLEAELMEKDSIFVK